MTGPRCVGLLAEGLDPARGGAERAIRATALALAARGVEVVIAAPADRLGPPHVGTVRIVPVDAPRDRPRRDLTLGRTLDGAARQAGAERTIACGKLLGADLYWPHGGVHGASRAAWTAAGRGRLAKAFARAGRALRPAEWALDALEARALDACRGGSSRAVALSRRVADDLRARHGVEPAAVVRNGVDPTRFAPPSAPERDAARAALCDRLGLPPAERPPTTLVLFVAHAWRLKGLDLLLAASRGLPGALVVVVGGDPAGAPAGGRVRFLGSVDDVAPLYRGADLLAHPSRYDPCSLVVLEALACGLPVVASDADGASELVGAGGLVVARDDAAALRAALARLSDPAARAAAAGAAASAPRRAWDDVARELLDLLSGEG